MRRPTQHDMETVSGRYLDVSDPDPEAIDVEDIAHHLARLCRYTGAVTVPHYSVAEHAVVVSWRLMRLGEPTATVLLGLHHDDAEAYLGDIGRPLKSLPKMRAAYGPLEAQMQAAIAFALELPDPTPDAVAAIKEADDWAIAREAHELLPSAGKGWFCDDGRYAPDPDALPLGWSSTYAKEAFLRLHRGLVARLALEAAQTTAAFWDEEAKSA